MGDRKVIAELADSGIDMDEARPAAEAEVGEPTICLKFSICLISAREGWFRLLLVNGVVNEQATHSHGPRKSKNILSLSKSLSILHNTSEIQMQRIATVA